MEEQKKSEGTVSDNKENKSEQVQSQQQSEGDARKEEVEKVETTVENQQDSSSDSESEKTIDEIGEEDEKSRTIKNLVSLVIILAGFAVGSLFIDIIQFVSGSGFSQKALKESEVFVAGDKTWVAFSDPAVGVDVLTVSDDELSSCENCDPTDVLVWLRRFVPTLISNKVVSSSPEGQEMIKKYGVKTLPAFVFSTEIEDTGFYQGEASVLFEENDGKYVLNSAGLGIPVGKYLQVPAIETTDEVLGNKEAPIKIFVYSDFQCPFCSQFYTSMRTIAKEYGEDKVALVYKDLPLDFHPQAENAANAARCAQDQQKFWEMADLLYGNQDAWGESQGVTTFKGYAGQLGLNKADFDKCIDEKQFADLIEKDVAEAGNFGISGTPAAFINDHFVSGVVSVDELKKVIDEQLGN